MKKLLVVLLLLGAALTGATYWLSHARSPTNLDDFKYEQASVREIVETVSATGGLSPVETIIVGSERVGKVVQIFANADLNKEVEEGEPLIQLEDSIARQELEEAQAGVAAAEAAVEAARSNLTKANVGLEAARLTELRLREAVQSGAGFRREHDEAAIRVLSADAEIQAAKSGITAAQSKLESAKAARSKAEKGLELMTIRVPTRREPSDQPGAPKRRYTVIDRKVILGQLIGPQLPTPLFTLASDLGQMQVHAQVAEGDVTKIKENLTATFTIHGYADDHVFQGKVVQIRPVPTNIQGAVFYTVVIDAANSRDPSTHEWRLRPVMTASVDIALRKHVNVWRLPTKTLSFQLEKDHRSEAGQRKFENWLKERKDADDWKPVWQYDAQQKGYPYFARIGGKNAQGEVGLKDGQYNEVLEWDPELKPTPDPNVPGTWPRFLIDAPPAQKPGLFSNFKQVKVF